MRNLPITARMSSLIVGAMGSVWGTCCLAADDVPVSVSLSGAQIVSHEPLQPSSVVSSDGPADLADWINDRFHHFWNEQQVTPQFCDDFTYLRRVSLDILGRIPSIAEIREFEADTSPEKRGRLVERLLRDPKDSSRMSLLAAEHLARVWRRVLLPPGASGAGRGPELEAWFRDQLVKNVSYDQLVRQLLTARGEKASGELPFYLAAGGTPEAEATEFSRAFLGIRIGCAQCHHHPFTDWKQSDFWGMAAFFSGLKLGRIRVVDTMTVADEILNDDDSQGIIAYEGVTYPAKVLWTDEPVTLTSKKRPRELLADWMTAAEHPTFSANAVNRIWQALLGRGLVAAVDDLDLESDDTRALVDDFGRQFAASHFDLRELVSAICRSEPYQCGSWTSSLEIADLRKGTRPLKALAPEQMFASLEQALSLPVSSSLSDAARHNGEMDQLVQRLSETSGRSPEEYHAGIPQTLLLMNGSLLKRATDLEQSHTLRGILDAPFLTNAERIEILYLATLSRKPNAMERNHLLDELEKRSSENDRRSLFGDLLWALVNSPEFVLCP